VSQSIGWEDPKGEYSAEGTTVMRKRIAGLGIDRRAVGAHLEETMPVPRPLFGPTTLKVNETKSDLQQLIERAQLEILYRHPR
jgi:hypothetical protein